MSKLVDGFGWDFYLYLVRLTGCELRTSAPSNPYLKVYGDISLLTNGGGMKSVTGDKGNSKTA